MGDSRKQLREFPEAVRFEIGQALYQAELGERHPSACAMQGLNAVEIVSDYRGDTYRGVYTTLKGFIYVLTAFRRNPKLESKRQSGTWIIRRAE
jgi:phage-related protein